MNLNTDLIALLKTNGSLWVIVACSVVSIATAIERAISLAGMRGKARHLSNGVGRALDRGSFDEAKAECEQSGSPLAQLYLTAIRMSDSRQDTGGLGRYTIGRIAATLERGRTRLFAGLRRGLWLVATVGATAPFVGLFGTVVGVMKSFENMARLEQGGFTVVAAGISEALVTTAAGIAVAVISVVLYNWLGSYTQSLSTEIRILTDEFLDTLSDLLARSVERPMVEGRRPLEVASGDR